MRRLLLDTGITYALLDRDDAWHARARALVETLGAQLLIPISTVPEICYFVAKTLGTAAERDFVRSLASEPFQVEWLNGKDVARSAAIMERYPRIGFVDASVVALAERLGLETIATTARRDFAVIRPRHVQRFMLVP
jgi:predicted nucleic acid-binding protein